VAKFNKRYSAKKPEAAAAPAAAAPVKKAKKSK